MTILNKCKFLVFLLALCIPFIIFADGQRKVRVEFFFQQGCRECDMIKKLVLPEIKERFDGLYTLNEFDTHEKDNFLKLADYQQKLKITSNEPVTIIVDRKIALCGYEKIKTELGNTIDRCLAESEISVQEPPKNKENTLEKCFSSFTVAAIILAGLGDGINPCAFSTLIFFISLLAVARVKAGKLLAGGATYCIATFITYTALGFGLLHFIKAFSGYSTVQLIFNYTMMTILVLLAVLSFRDAYRYSKSHDQESVSIQLPPRIKVLIRKVMHAGLHYKWLIPGAFVTGSAVTLLESVCTGQLYVPALALMAKESSTFLKGFLLLLLYNAMFLVPLLVVFTLAYFGSNTMYLISLSKHNIIPSKLLLGTLFLTLAIMIFLF